MSEHKSEHWTNGGTGLTNFVPEKFALYDEAVRSFGDPDFVVSRERMVGRGEEFHGGSLHYLKLPAKQDWETIGAFWKNFYKLRAKP